MTKPSPETVCFNKKARTYDSSAIPQKEAIDWVQGRISRIDLSAQILELGAGTGNWTRIWLKKGFKNYTVSDVNPAMIEVSKSKLQSNRVEYQVLDAWKENSEDEVQKYDVITSTNLLQWAPYFSPKKVFPFHSNLRSAGLSIHCIPIAPTLYEFYEWIPEIQPFSWKTADEWKSLFEADGFSILDLEQKKNTYKYVNLQSVLRSIHNTGATLKNKTLNLRPFIKKFNHPLHVTWNFLWIVARKSGSFERS
jgi:SAM-dependent methyltransferase